MRYRWSCCQRGAEHSGARLGGELGWVLALDVDVGVLVEVEVLVGVEGREVSRGGGVRVDESVVRELDRVDGGGGGSGVRTVVVDERGGDDGTGDVFVGRGLVVRAELAAVFAALDDTRVVFGAVVLGAAVFAAVVRTALVSGAVRAALVERVVAGAVDVSVVEAEVVSVPMVPLVPNTTMVESLDSAERRRSELPTDDDATGHFELDVRSESPNPDDMTPGCCTATNSGACATAGGPADTDAGGEAPAMAATTPAVEATSANVLTSTRAIGAFTSPP